MAPFYPPGARYGKRFQNPNPPSLFTSTMRTLLAPAFAALPATPVFGPDSNSKIAAEVRLTLAAAQVTASHEYDQDAIKTQMLRSAIVLAPYRDKVDLSGATRAIGSINEHVSGSNHRHLALTTFQAYGASGVWHRTRTGFRGAQSDAGTVWRVASVSCFRAERQLRHPHGISQGNS